MEARGKTIEQWFSMIEQGQIMLPRFQRHEAWRHSQIVGLLENVLRKPSLPIGALLVLEVGDEEPFHSRPMVGAPAATGRVTMHLLDGQQRMTALWRSLIDNYEDLTVFVSLAPPSPPEDLEPGEVAPDEPVIERERRWEHKGGRRPLWADDPIEVYKRGMIPIACLRPGQAGEKALNAFFAALKVAGIDHGDKTGRIYELRSRVASYVVPFLSLPVGTGRETALNVFIKMNTSASPLTDYDIVVAQLEESTGESLHEMVEELLVKVPDARRYGSIEDNLLSVAALLGGKPPLKKSYLEKGFGAHVADVWPRLLDGFKRGVSFLQNEGMFGERTMPSDVAVYLVCALWADVPEHGFDAEGNARALIRKALWRASFTDRYGKTSATRAYADYKALAAMIAKPSETAACELFDDATYALPEPGELVSAGWPARKDRLPRAILAAALRAGGIDFADGAPARQSDLTQREYHHIFPVATLSGDREDAHVNRALNCALVNWRTNRKIASGTPQAYIEARAKAANLGESAVRHRLASHLIPYEAVVAGDYEAFLNARAAIVQAHLKALCEGREPAATL